VIVGFEVYPKSFGNQVERKNGCPADLRSEQPGLELYVPQNRTRLAEQYPSSSYLPEEDELDDGAMLSITHSYSVYFREEPNIEWHNRWALYFTNQQEGKRTHWLAIVNSLIISGFLGVSVLVIWGRTVQGDIRGRGDGVAEDGLKFRPRKSGLKSPRPDGDSSNGLLEVEGGEKIDVESLLEEEMEEVAPWKRLHGDVFRIPPYAGLLAPIVGSGMQLLIMAAGLLLLSCFGILNPSFRGGFVSVGIALFILAGAFSGYFSARLYRTFAGQNFLKNTLLVSPLTLRLSNYQVLTERHRRPSSSPAWSSGLSSSSTSSSGPRLPARLFPLAPSLHSWHFGS
jgi:transmembrane 9 superfamily protein 2/4